MFESRSEYDRGVNTFSPEGRLFQIEYAIEAVKLGTTALGLHTSEGIVLAAEKRISSPMLDHTSVNKITTLDSHLGCVMSGLTPDAQTLVEHARVQAQNHRFTYNTPMRVEACTLSVCDLALGFGEGRGEAGRTMSRPFGVAMLIAGVDDLGPALFHMEPSGTFYKYKCHAIGAGSEGVISQLQGDDQNVFHSSLTLAEAELLATRLLKAVMEERISSTNFELGSVTLDGKFTTYPQSKLESLIAAIA